MIEEFAIWGRKRDFVANDALLAELKTRGFEPHIVGEIDPPPKNGGSWVLRDKRDRRAHEDGGVWISWVRPRASESREGFSVKYVVETFDGRSGWDWYLSCAVAAIIAQASQGKVAADGGTDRDAAVFVAELAKDPSTDFRGPESIVDWESKNLDEDEDEEEGSEDEEYADSEEDDDEDEDDDEVESEDSDADDEDDDADDDEAEGDSDE